MPAPALLLLIATLLPLAGFVVLLFIGKRLGSPLAGWTASTFIAGSFACTLVAMIKWYDGARGAETWGLALRPIFRTIGWLPGGGTSGALEVGVYIDSLTIAMFAMVTLVAAIIHIYTIGFTRRDADSSRAFAWMGLACFAMLGMVLSGTLLQLLGLWILIGISSSLLAGFRFETPAGSRSSLRIFILNRIGDCGMLIGFGLLFSRLGNTSLPALWAALGDAAAGHAVVLSDGVVSTKFITLAGLSLFCGAAVRSAQFPLHLWLADASDAPIPAAAMISAVTSSAAGVYLVGRLFPLLTPDARLLIGIVGLTTLTMASLISLVQRDLPRLLAWITVAQLGYMMLAMGVGSWLGGLFAMITHAFIMGSLFLAAGSVISANAGQRDMLKMAGGWKHLPVTSAAFAVGALAMAGTPLLSKYYSQMTILTDAGAFASFAAGAGRARGYALFFLLPTACAYLLAFSIARCWMLTFAGRRADADPSLRPREQPALWVPLLILTLPAIVAGYAMNVPELLQRSMLETTALCEELRAHNAPAERNHFAAFDQAWPAAQPTVAAADPTDAIEPAVPNTSRAAEALENGRVLARRWAWWAWLVGIGAAVALYWRGNSRDKRLLRSPPLRWIHAWLDNEMYFAELYEWTAGRAVIALALACGAIDRYVLDGAIRGGAWAVARAIRAGKRMLGGSAPV
ncbi:MAG TPA: proton-conducting transporter membrane subunit [Tepidisphaeraceae bacterium]|jgi:NADH:ubiquinone oxidoreductase subunit 5 (subunit L)/multisubunit Na+/H+ antiporter MnhA subunit|nr:proton-conducting transporter membrane subunit [Tepidisphaeraceae bacterium]